eukprot:2704402-Alexandrium_andersonii.AAC.1
MGSEFEYGHSDSFRQSDRHLMDYAIATCRCRDSWGMLCEALQRNPMCTMHGRKAWGRKNLP